MAVKDISDLQVLDAFDLCSRQTIGERAFPYEILMQNTGQTFKVCYRAMERAHKRGLIDYGVSLRTGWITKKGFELIKSRDTSNGMP